MNTPIVQLKDICFGYGEEEVLCSISLDIHKGDFIGIIGPNGSGKTTLIRILLGLMKPGSGDIKLFGKSLNKFKEFSKIGYVPQKATQIDITTPITVEEIISLATENKKNVADALHAVDLTSKKDKLIRELSGGQQQRAFIAKALASQPDLLILDEPTTGVDVNTQDEFYSLLAKLNKTGLTIVLVSHDIDVVVNEVNKLVCLNKKLVYQGTPKQFVKDEYLEKLYGSTRRMIIHKH